ncbi:MAG: S9 family peptidase [Bdellovibrio sp.]
MNKIIVILTASFGVSCMHSNYLNYPRPEKIKTQLTKHGDIRVDDYFWLRERKNPRVIDYIQKENAYTEEMMKPVKGLEGTIYSELKSRIKEDESSVPVKDGDYFYSARYEAGQQYPLYIRQKGSSGQEEILINVPELSKGHKYFNSTGPRISLNQNMLAYAVDTVGRRFYTIYFKDLKTGQMLSDRIENVTSNFTWANDNETIFYTQQNPETLRAEKIYRYNLKTKEKDLIYFEKDDTFSVSVYKSLSDKFIYINSAATLSTEVHFLPADKPFEKFKVFSHREKNHEYSVTDGGDKFYIITNKNAPNFKLMVTDINHTQEKHWNELIPHREDTYLENVSVFKNFIALDERHDGLTQVRIAGTDASHPYKITFSDSSYIAFVGDNREFDSEWLRFSYQSLRIPDSVYEINVKTKEQVLKKTKEIPNYNANLYATERVFLTVRDGTKVPVSLIMKKDFKRDNKAPMLIYGYGSYGVNMDPWYDSDIFSLVDRGFIYAKAHIRGGSEMGRQWYDHGRGHYKMNTFNDFIDVTESLIKQGYADPKHIFAMGGSAGGLLMGAIMNLRPDLYHGIVAQVPFVDVISTMLDESIPLTTSEYDQWGNPNNKDDYAYIRKYSPYDNVKDQAYPNVLVTTGFHDSQVQYWEPAKWVPKLREHNKANSLIMLKTDMEAGHSGASGRFNQLKDTATEYAFILMVNDK